MRLLDLFCGAGGAGMGYHRAGFEVVGVDRKAQPHYPFEFIQGDALEYLAAEGHKFDMIHASPPCQLFSVTAHLANAGHEDLIEPTRKLLKATGKPYVMENVPRAPLENPIILCGTMFHLAVIRHRAFECWPPVYMAPAMCCHFGGATGGQLRRRGITRLPSLADGFSYVTVVGNNYLAAEGRAAMGIDWMNKKELSQAIPPKYTEWLGGQMRRAI